MENLPYLPINEKDIINKFKNLEQSNQIICLFNKPYLAEILSAFQILKVERNIKHILLVNKEEETNEDILWNKLWESYTINQRKYEQITTIRGNRLRSCIEILKGYRLIYPDGTINQYAKIFLKDFIQRRLKITQPTRTN